MWVHVLAEPAHGPQLPVSTVPTAMYGELHASYSQVPICLRNLSVHPIVISTKVITGKVTPANQVPLVALPMGTLGESAHSLQKDWILEELNLQGLDDWPKDEQEQVKKLLIRWKHLFTCSNLDLGKTSLIKHQIELNDWMPFKECYW